MKRGFYGNYRAGHVKKAKLRKQIYISTHTQYEGTGPSQRDPSTEDVGCPLIHLQTWKSRPSQRAQRQGDKASGDRGPIRGEKPRQPQPTVSGGGQQGPSQAHCSSVAAPCSHRRVLPLPATTCKSPEASPVAPGGPSKSPWKPKRHNGEGCARASPAGERGLGTRKGGNGGGSQGPLEEARTG